MSEYNVNNTDPNTHNENNDITNSEVLADNANATEPTTENTATTSENTQADNTIASQANSVSNQSTSNQSNMQTPPYSHYYNSQYRPPYQNPYFRQEGGASYTFSNNPSFGADINAVNTKKEKKKSSGALKVAAIILSCVLLASATGIGGAYLTYTMLSDNISQGNNDSNENTQNNSADTSPDVDRAPVTINKVEGSTIENTTMTDVIAAVRDTVVEIVTENIKESQFYGQYVTSGAGSGVIINENGYIITNNHVVSGANTIYVRTTDEKEYKAVLVGADEESDVAVIKIDATGLKAATLGDSSAIKLGEDVIAIGNPLGSLGGTVTNGIISALDREVTIDGQKMVLLQTNAAVNPGNSGGGLFNMAGQLIGVVNAKSSSSSSGATIEGLGFAIPINHAFNVASQLIEFGYVRGKVSLGISVNEYEKDMVYKQGFSYYTIKAGVYVENPGKNTELKKNDRFVSIKDTTVSSMADIKAILAECKVGDQIKCVVARTQNNKEIQVEVTLTCYEFVPEKN